MIKGVTSDGVTSLDSALKTLFDNKQNPRPRMLKKTTLPTVSTEKCLIIRVPSELKIKLVPWLEEVVGAVPSVV